LGCKVGTESKKRQKGRRTGGDNKTRGRKPQRRTRPSFKRRGK